VWYLRLFAGKRVVVETEAINLFYDLFFVSLAGSAGSIPLPLGR